MWLSVAGETGLIGITEFAQRELGEIVYVDLPAVGKHFSKDEIFGSVEAVKTTSDLFMPVGGEVVEINNELKEQAGFVNTDPYRKGWMLKIRLSDPSEEESLLTDVAYQNLVG